MNVFSWGMIFASSLLLPNFQAVRRALGKMRETVELRAPGHAGGQESFGV